MLMSLRTAGFLWAMAPETESTFFQMDGCLLGIHLAIRDV